MNSIANKIRNTLVGSIALLSVFVLLVLVVNNLGVLQNRKIISTMTREYSIINLSQDTIAAYNAAIKNPEDEKVIASYTESRNTLLGVIEQLKSEIAQPESQLLMVGVERTVNQVIKECDSGLAEGKQGNFENSPEHFTQAYKYNEFVYDNVRTLLQKELEYLSRSEGHSQQLYILTLSASILLFFLLIVAMLYYARYFSRQLITPLSTLSNFAEEVANGNITVPKKETTAFSNDEIGSLTKSIYKMVDELHETLQKEHRAAEEAKQANIAVEKNNEVLQKMNALMVGREMKMIELKKKIAQISDGNEIQI